MPLPPHMQRAYVHVQPCTLAASLTISACCGASSMCLGLSAWRGSLAHACAGMLGAGRGPKDGSRPGYLGSGLAAKESGVYHPQGYTTNNMGRTVPARPIEMISSDDDDF